MHHRLQRQTAQVAQLHVAQLARSEFEEEACGEIAPRLPHMNETLWKLL